MKNHFLVNKVGRELPQANIFANRSGLILHELLTRPRSKFQVRDLARELGVSHGLVQRVLSALVNSGVVETDGVRTAKQFELVNPGRLLLRWINAYSISAKCQFFNYSCGYSAEAIKEKIFETSNAKRSRPVFALHSAARAHGCGFSNLQTTEMYISSSEQREQLEALLKLQPRERGYEVLLLKPYYGSIIEHESMQIEGMSVSSPLLTFLELYHFPLRGNEQAEHLLAKHPALQYLATALRGALNELR